MDRFEVLEEETHYPAAHPKSLEKQADNQPEAAVEEKEEETLEQQLERLVLSVKSDKEVDASQAEEKNASQDKTENVKRASGAKELGNKFFSRGSYLDAIECYTTALKLCPPMRSTRIIGNRAACLMRLGRTEESVDDCTQAVTLSPTYVKALLRRAEAFEKLDKLEEALADYDAVLKIDPTVRTAVKSHERLQKIVHERQEKMKAEMLDKLKGFGNTILGKFGLSTDNFQMVQDPATGSYSVNFQQNPGQQQQK
ncbi:Tetratricopeptide repeat [Phytophthora infestans]|uniref:Tetratricopeptide repeat n=1 Tax=Phytophthora infestans TaxID=4787 RepID=A0A833SWE7_PHYIN|nr:Tetratricopeptide repeat [Phytophthora infestans]